MELVGPVQMNIYQSNTYRKEKVKSLSNTEAKLKKTVGYKKACNTRKGVKKRTSHEQSKIAISVKSKAYSVASSTLVLKLVQQINFQERQCFSVNFK